MKNGMLIVIEGADAVGKATQSARLADRIFNELGRESQLISFPIYGTDLGRVILAHLKGEISLAVVDSLGKPVIKCGEDALVFQCMMAVDKYAAAPFIDACLKSGVTVVCDRYWQSALTYGAADGLDKNWLFEIHRRLPQPDLSILIELSADEALKRRPDLRDRYERDRAKQVRVREEYRELWTSGLRGRWEIVSGAQSEDAVHEAIWNLVKEGR